jgi:hypothetical protein
VRISLRAIGVVLVAAAALASCGEEQDDSPAAGAGATSGDPELVVRRYFAAFTRGDARAACGLMTKVAQRGMQQLPEGERAHSCEAATRLLTRDTLAVSRPEVQDLQISGGTATARVTSKDPPYDSGVMLRRVGGGWKIAFPLAVVTQFKDAPGIKAHDDEPHGRE